MELKISKRGGSSLKRTTVLEQRSEDSGLHPACLGYAALARLHNLSETQFSFL